MIGLACKLKGRVRNLEDGKCFIRDLANYFEIVYLSCRTAEQRRLVCEWIKGVFKGVLRSELSALSIDEQVKLANMFNVMLESITQEGDGCKVSIISD